MKTAPEIRFISVIRIFRVIIVFRVIQVIRVYKGHYGYEQKQQR